MASCDSLMLLLHQFSNDVCSYKSNIRNVFALVGAWYALRFTVKLSYGIIKYTKHNMKMLCCTKNYVKEYGAWAVITGCTSGIGRAFAHKLAKKGLNIVLISRNSEALHKEAELIQDMYGVHTLVIVCDFNNTVNVSTSNIREILNELDIGILINNAGVHYDYPMEFHMVNEDRVESLVQVNITSTVVLTRIVLPGMINRRRGLVVNMSSAAGILPFPLISLYSASKGFLNNFSQSLHDEMHRYNVHVQTLTPLYISTKMIKYSKLLKRNRVFAPSPETYVNSAVKTFGYYESNVGYFPHALQMWIIRACPRFLVLKVGYWFNRHLHYEGLTYEKNQ